MNFIWILTPPKNNCGMLNKPPCIRLYISISELRSASTGSSICRYSESESMFKESLLLSTRNPSYDDCVKCHDHMSVTSKGMPCRCTGLSRRRNWHFWRWHFTDWRGSAGGLLSWTSGHQNRRWNRRVWWASLKPSYEYWDQCMSDRHLVWHFWHVTDPRRLWVFSTWSTNTGRHFDRVLSWICQTQISSSRATSWTGVWPQNNVN